MEGSVVHLEENADLRPTTECRYVIITPVRNEGLYLDDHIASVVQQTIRPIEWIIIDDGSTDATQSILSRWVGKYSWIHSRRRHDRGFRHAGTGVIEAFYNGYSAIQTTEWEYLVKLDGDLILPQDYFAKCIGEFTRDSCLGIGGGLVCDSEDTNSPSEQGPSFHVRGAVKMYRRECWDAIGGLITSPGWDTVDELKANFLGWHTRSFRELRVLHQRPTGAADGRWKNALKNGLANYVTAYHPLFMILKCLRRVLNKPYGVEALGLFCGFLSGYIYRVPRVSDSALVGYIRRQQLSRLLMLNSIWR